MKIYARESEDYGYIDSMLIDEAMSMEGMIFLDENGNLMDGQSYDAQFPLIVVMDRFPDFVSIYQNNNFEAEYHGDGTYFYRYTGKGNIEEDLANAGIYRENGRPWTEEELDTWATLASKIIYDEACFDDTRIISECLELITGKTWEATEQHSRYSNQSVTIWYDVCQYDFDDLDRIAHILLGDGLFCEVFVAEDNEDVADVLSEKDCDMVFVRAMFHAKEDIANVMGCNESDITILWRVY